jgi:hypothetical protein
MRFRSLLALSAAILASGAVQAGPVSWTSFTDATATTATGTLLVGMTSVDVRVSSSASLFFTQINDVGINYYTSPAPATTYAVGGQDATPTNVDIIALGQATTVTVTFSEAVLNPVLAMVSWNVGPVTFSDPITVLSQGTGYWGNGTFVPVGTDGFSGSGEPHGLIQVNGSLTSFELTAPAEFWHGFTVGVIGLAPPPPTDVPAPAALGLFGLALAGLIAARRR